MAATITGLQRCALGSLLIPTFEWGRIFKSIHHIVYLMQKQFIVKRGKPKSDLFSGVGVWCINEDNAWDTSVTYLSASRFKSQPRVSRSHLQMHTLQGRE